MSFSGKICTPEHRAKISAALTGRKRKPFSSEHRANLGAANTGNHHSEITKIKMRKPKSLQTRARMSASLRGRAARGTHHNSLDLPNCGCYVHGANRPYMVSSYTWKLAEALVIAGFEVVIPEQQFGHKRVDALLGEEWLAIEADGKYHFTQSRKAYDKKRDLELLECFNLPVVRLSGVEVEALWKELCRNA